MRTLSPKTITETTLCILIACLSTTARPVHEEQIRSEEPRPLVGILSQPGSPAPEGSTYIAASYVKLVEASGGRAVPIQCDLPPEEVERKFRAVNAVLIPGGGATLSPGHPFYDTTARLLGLTLAANDAGDYFPLHGTCLGMEALAVALSRPFNTNVLSVFDATDDPSPLELTEAASRSRFLGTMAPDVLDSLQSAPVAMENHHWGVSDDTFLANDGLRDFFEVTSHSLDRQGRRYISTMEAKQYPVTAVQWHPEKNAYEWAPQLHIPHSPAAVEVTHAMGDYLLREARKNKHRPASQAEETELLISNYKVTFTGQVRATGGRASFDECYFFAAQGGDAAPDHR